MLNDNLCLVLTRKKETKTKPLFYFTIKETEIKDNQTGKNQHE